MKLIKELKKDNFKITHHHYIDDFGIKQDAFEFIEVKPNGYMIKYPFIAPIKVSTYTRNQPITNATEYTEQEYEELLDSSIKKYGGTH